MRKLSYAAAATIATPLHLFAAVPAHGDQDAVSAYVSEHGDQVCGFIREQPGLPGVKHAVDNILATSELPQQQTGQLLGASVVAFCPDSAGVVREFVWYVQRRQQSAGPGS